MKGIYFLLFFLLFACNNNEKEVKGKVTGDWLIYNVVKYNESKTDSTILEIPDTFTDLSRITISILPDGTFYLFNNKSQYYDNGHALLVSTSTQNNDVITVAYNYEVNGNTIKLSIDTDMEKGYFLAKRIK